MLAQCNTCVLLPTIHRPTDLRATIYSIQTTAPEVHICVAYDQNDPESGDIARSLGCKATQCSGNQQGCANAWNEALRGAGYYEAYVLGADDLIFKPGWFEATAAKLEELGGSGVVGFNDLRKPVDVFDWSTHWLITRDFIIEHNGGVMAIPHYLSDYVDYETCKRAILARKFIKAPLAHVEHHWRGMRPDKYWNEQSKSRAKSRHLAEQREAAGWPNDFRPVIGGEPRPGGRAWRE